MLYARKAAQGASPGRRKLFAAAGTAIVIASLAVGITSAVPSNFVELDGNVIKDGAGTYDWANSGALTTTNGFYTRAGTGGLFDGGQFNGNTTPPTAPTLTAAAAADTTIADAAFKVDPLSVDTTSCGSGDPTVYTGQGSETNGDLISSETYSTGSIPNKDDLSNVYAVAHISTGVNEVFFGAERVVSNGDSHIDFEFLQSEVALTGTCIGSFTGDRTQGDFLLAIDFTAGGTLGGSNLYEWQCTVTYNAALDGTICNPAATGKSIPHYELTGTDAVTLIVNAGATPIGCGGWVCRNADGTPTTTLAQNELMEGGIDLKQLGFTGCVSTFLPHTRSSQSFTAVLKDFEIIPFDTCANPTIATQVKLVSDGTSVTPATPIQTGVAVYDTATLTGQTSDAGGTVTYKLYTDATCTTLSLSPAMNVTVDVANGIVPDSNTVTGGSVSFTNGGTWYFQATYSGDVRNLVPAGGAKSACTSEAVTVKNNPSVSTTIKNASNIAIGGTAQSIGVVLHDTATITGATATAGGTITYALYSNIDCTGLLADLTPTVNTVVNGIAPDSKTFTFSNAGTFYFYAVYSGDANNTGPVNSGCASEPVTINPNTPAPHSTPLVQIKDTFSATGFTANATGSVVVGLYTNATCTTRLAGTSDTTVALSTAVNGTISGETTFVGVLAGTYYYKLSYAGDANNTSFSSCAEIVGVQITSLP